MKRCSQCDMPKQLECFSPDKKARGGRRRECKACRSVKDRQHYADPAVRLHRKQRNITRKYDITPEQYDLMLEAQGGVCYICERPPPPHRRLAVDHDHKTGHVRGLLCTRCNLTLGIIDNTDDPIAVLRRMIAYLSPDAIRHTHHELDSPHILALGYDPSEDNGN